MTAIAGISGGNAGAKGGDGGTVIIYGGTVGAYGSSGIGGGYGYSNGGNGGNVEIYGGKVTTGADYVAGIGGGTQNADHGTLTVGRAQLVFGGNSQNPTTVIKKINNDYARYRYMTVDTRELADDHEHTFVYTASGNTISATCSVENCEFSGLTPITLTLEAPSPAYDGNPKEAVLSGYPDDAPQGLAAAPTGIVYYTATAPGSTETTGSALSGAPTDAGNFVAQVTWGGETISVPFSVEYSLTINDGTYSYSNFPVYGYNADCYQKSQFVIPASNLTNLQGMTLTEMQFYLSYKADKVWNGTFEVYLGPCDFDLFSSLSFADISEHTKVYTGTLDGTGDTMNVVFDTGYTYTGTKKTVKFTVDGKETTVAVPATAEAKGYVVTCNVVAAQMAHKISAVVYAGDTALDQTDSYSVQDYAEAVYAEPGKYLPADEAEKAPALKALAAAMLHYGSEAQTVFDSALYSHPNRADSNLDEAADYTGVDADAVLAAINGEASDLNAVATDLNAKYHTNSLIYLQNNTLRVYFTPTTYPADMPNASAYDGNLSNYYYYKDKANIAAAELDNQQDFTVGNVTFKYSPLNYVVNVLNSNMSPEQKNLAKSLFLYNQAANAFFDAAPVHTHTIVSVAEVPATHEAAGTAAHYKCSECEELFTDANGENATTAEALVIPRNKNVNLATLTGNITLLDGDIVTGTLQGNKQISVASGATVTLKDANITCLTDSAWYAGITPLGDATILLEGENTLKGGYEDYPGIFVPENTTLTIDGTGSLVASSNGYGCGIGGGYQMAAGNIVIDGGTITANGGQWAAGIGSGYEGSCGNITINGGTITANGGEEAAGIGSGQESNCGDITIAGTVTQVTATKGEDATNSIGAGESGSCGTISIADPSKVTEN